MLKKLLLICGLLALLMPAGCNTTKPYMWGWAHNKRHFRTIFNNCHEVHKDLDRILFDMEYYPVEVAH